MGSVLRSDVRRSDFLRVVQTASAGDSQAVDKLVAYCLPQIASYLGRRGAAHPEALANQVLAEFVGNLSRLEFKSQERVWSYLYSVARSRLLDEKRVVRLEQPTECIDGPDARSRSFDDAVVNEMWVSDLLSKLTDDQRRVVELRYHEDLTLEETAKRTGKTLTAVKGLQRRALAALAAAAAIAAAVIVVLLAVRFLQNPGINVQSLQPAGGSEQTTDGNGGTGTGGVRTEDGTTTTLNPGQRIGSGTPGSVGQPGGRPMQEPLPVDDGTGLPAPSTTSVSTPPTSQIPSATTATTSKASTTTVATAPPPPPVLGDDRAGFVSAPGNATWVDVDVLANDPNTVDPATLRIVTPFSAGFGEIIEAPEGPVIRFHATGPGASVGRYEVCEPGICHQANVTVNQIWYTDYANNLCETLAPTIIGTAGADVIVGTAGKDVIFGLGGDDDIDGLGGADIICGGAGADLISGGLGDDILFGGDGDDEIVGNAGADSIYGGEGADFIYGDQGADQLFGGAGNDEILGGTDADAMFGEAGDDRMYGGGQWDTMFGGIGSDLLDGRGGSDLIKGGPGRDTLIGGSGNDRLVGDPAEDHMSEGDVVSYEASESSGASGGTDGDDGSGGSDDSGASIGPDPVPIAGGPSDYYG